MAVVHIHRAGIYDKAVCIALSYSEKIIGGKHKRTQVKRAALFSRYPGIVYCNKLLQAFHKYLLGKLRHTHTLRRAVQTVKIIKRPEKGHFSRLIFKGFHALKNSLPVMQGRQRRAHGKLAKRFYAKILPGTIFIVADKHMVGKHTAKNDVLKIK